MYLQKGHLSKLTRGQEAQEVATLHIVLAKLCAHYKDPTSWGTPLTVPFTWYWEILGRTCQLVKPGIGSLDLSWCRDGHLAVSLLAQVYSVYSEVFSVTSLQSVPEDVEQCRDDHVRKYFQWVRDIQQFIRSWEQKIINGDWTEEEIKLYANMAIPLHKIALSLHIEALEVDLEIVAAMKTEMQALKPSVKNTLIRIDSDGRRYLCVYACVYVWLWLCLFEQVDPLDQLLNYWSSPAGALCLLSYISTMWRSPELSLISSIALLKTLRDACCKLFILWRKRREI